MAFNNPVVGGGGGLIRDWIKSPNYVTGVSGWSINRDGTAEFNDVVIRGTLESNNYVAGVSGWQINQDGTAEFNEVTMRGTWTIRTGNNELQGTIDTPPTNPYDPAPVPVPTITFNPDVTAYDEGFVYGKPLAVDGRTQLVFTSPNFTAGGADRAYAALVQDYQEGYNFWDVTGLSFADYHHDAAAQITTNTASSAAVAPGNTVTMATVTGDTVDSPFSLLMVMAGWHGITLGAPSATIGNNRVTMQIAEDGSQVRGARLILQNTTQTQSGGTLIYVGPPPPAAGSHTYDLKMTHEAGSSAGTASCNASGTSPAWIAVKGF